MLPIEIRKKAEEIITDKNRGTQKYTEDEIEAILNELSIHQVELELQNEELVKLQEELNLTLAKYYDLYENAPVGYIKLDENLQILETNRTFSKFIGLSKELLIGKELSLFVAPENQDSFYFHYQTVKKYANYRNITEITVISKTNNRIVFQADSEANYDNDGNLIIKTVFTDISNLKNIENQLKIEQKRYETLFETVPVGIFTIDLNNHILSWNKELEKITGYTKEEVIGKKCNLCLSDYKICDFWDELLINEKSNRIKKILTKDGEVKSIFFQYGVVRDENYNPIYGINTLYDLSENLKNQENINRLQLALNTTEDNIIIFNFDTLKIVAINQSFTKDLGYTEEEAAQLTVADIKRRDFNELKEFLRKNLLNKNQAFFFTDFHYAKDGRKIPVEIQLKTFYSEGNLYGIAVARNISKRLEYQSKIIEQQNFLNAIIENLPVGIFAKNPLDDFKFTIWNKKMEEMFGIKASEAI